MFEQLRREYDYNYTKLNEYRQKIKKYETQ